MQQSNLYGCRSASDFVKVSELGQGTYGTVCNVINMYD